MTNFTTAAFVRSHGHEPRGTGSWAFQPSATFKAFDRDLAGEVLFVQGTLAEAKREARRHFGKGVLLAVLP